MNKKKIFLVAGISLLSVGVLAACGNSNSESKKSTTYTYVYTSEPETLDYLVSGKTTTHDLTANVVDGLLENDTYGNFIPSLAEDWKVSKDGLTYTYTLREGVKWYTSDGEEYADVKAQDFITGLKHAVDKKSEQLYLVQHSIAGLDDYVQGKTSDFSKVGVKVIDDRTVQYTLAQPETYWNSKMTTGIMSPLNEEFLKSKGDDFGKVTIDSILYNGPYIIKDLTAKSSQELVKNENYWDKDNVHIEDIKLSYYDGSDPESLIKNFSDGTYTSARVFPTSSTFKSVEEKYKDNINYSLQGSGTYIMGMNIDRKTYNNTAKTTDAQKTSTTKALQNKDFRQALGFAFNRSSFIAQSAGKEGATKAARNLFVPPTFVTVGESSFGDLVEKDVQAYGDEWKDVNFDDAQDGLYNVDKAKEEFAKAKEALQAEGVEFPIHLDTPIDKSDKISVARIQSLKQFIEEALGKENVVVDIHQIKEDDLYNITYYAPTAKEEDWDLNLITGWLPDYQDPSTYLDNLRTDKVSDNLKTYLGIDKDDKDVIEKVGLPEFNKLMEEASKETTDPVARYTKFAAAQAWLTDSALIVPWGSDGASPSVSKQVPFSAPFAWSGNKGYTNYKYRKLQDDVVTVKEYNKALEQWQKERAESNAKAQEDLAKHVE